MGEREHGAVDAPGYEILERVGGSEGADVHLAQQHALGRRVALKVLRGESSDAEQLARFEFETRTAAALLHPHIVPLLDSGTTRDGRRYYAMPWLAGGDLAARIPVEPAELRRIALALCDALWYAHGRNVVHRDIKPSNVLFDEHGRAMLSDFGIATSIIGPRGLTVPGRTLGSARYISPEQARGEKVDPRADLYSLGVVLYEALTGAPPFDARDEVSLATQHAEAPVPRLPERFAAWQAFFDRALAKDPGARFMSARTMAQALEMIDLSAAPAVAREGVPPAATAAAAVALDELPRIHAEPPSYLEGGARSRPAPRPARWAGAVVLLGVVALAGIIAFALTRSPEEAFEPLAVDPDAATAPLPAPTPPPVVESAPPAGRVAAAAVNTPVPAAPASSKPAGDGDVTLPRPAAPRPPPGSTGDDEGDVIAREIPGDRGDRADSEREDEYAIPDEEEPQLADATDSADADYSADAPDTFDTPGEDDDAPYDDASAARETPDYASDPALAGGSWSPPIGPLLLGDSPDEQLESIDAQIDAGRAWLEDERFRVDALQDTLPANEAERELEAFASDEQAFERWLDRMEALRSRIERDRY